MKKSRLLPRSGFPAWLAALLALCLFACAPREAARPDAGESAVRARLGNFALAVTAPDADNMVRPELLYNNRELAAPDDPVRDVSVKQSRRDFPLPGCESLTVEMFTGGANCCFGYYLLTRCPNGEYAASIEPGEGGLGDGVRNLRAYPATDASFFYYEPPDQSGNDRFSLSRAESPRLTRYLVFDDGAWRADRAGEFKAVYAGLLDRTAGDKQMNRAARAISMAYYSLMAGKGPDIAARALRRNLPKQYAGLASAIFADITTAVEAFGPVRNLVIDR